MIEAQQDAIITSRSSSFNIEASDAKNLQQTALLSRQESSKGPIFALLASAMGTGIFNLPARASQVGLIPFLLFLFIAGLFSLVGMKFMAKLIKHGKFKSYGQMSQAAYGKFLKRVSELCIIIYPWGITICFQVIFSQFLCQIIHDNLGVILYEQRDKDILNEKGNLFRVCINIGCSGMALIFALKRNIQILQKIAIVGVTSVIFNISAIVFLFLTGFERPDDGTQYSGILDLTVSKIKWAQKIDDPETYSIYCQAIASILFCYVNHQMLFPLSQSLKRPTSKVYSKIIYRSHIIQFLAYTIIGITAYLLLVQHISTHPIAPVVIASIPINVVLIGKILMLCALFFAVPLNMFPARQSFLDAANLEKSNKNHVIVTMGLMCSSTLIAILFIKVNSYFGLLGGTAGVFMAGGIPSLCYFKLRRSSLKKFDYFLLGFCAAITIVASLGAVLSVFKPE